jgi:hypothetical protein
MVLVLVLEVRYATQFGFYAPGPNWPHIPKWLEEVSCNLQSNSNQDSDAQTVSFIGFEASGLSWWRPYTIISSTKSVVPESTLKAIKCRVYT